MTSTLRLDPSCWKRLRIGTGEGSDAAPEVGDAPARLRAFEADRPLRTSHGRSSGRPAYGPDALRFLREWLRDPIGTAALAPSGRALTALITRDIDHRSGSVLELGPGTGVFTHGLLTRGVAERDITLVEQNPTFARLLRRRFPKAKVLGIDAIDLGRHGAVGAARFGAAVCGLGLRNMEATQVEAILRAAFERMRPEAAFYLFTYGARCSVPSDTLDRLGLAADRVGTTMRNMPPASVFRIVRRAADAVATVRP